MEQFEKIDNSITEIRIRDALVKIKLSSDKFEKLGIKIDEYENPNKLIGFGELIRYFNETNPKIINATQKEIKSQLPNEIPKLMTIDKFYHLSVYEEERLPSQIETYQLIAKVLVKKDTKEWKPSLQPNNHWSNWESGHL